MRCSRCTKWRTPAWRLPAAAVSAGLRGQYEHQVAAPIKGPPRVNEPGRDFKVLDLLRTGGRCSLPTDGRKVGDHFKRPRTGAKEPGLYQISGMAWSGAGRIARVEVSADGGATWGEAALCEPVLDKAVTRFRMAWRWNGAETVIMSRAADEAGDIQPARDAIIAAKGRKFAYHYNGIQAWGIDSEGQVANVYA